MYVISRLNHEDEYRSVVAEYAYTSEQLRQAVERFKNDTSVGDIVSVSKVVWSWENCVDDDGDMPTAQLDELKLTDHLYGS